MSKSIVWAYCCWLCCSLLPLQSNAVFFFIHCTSIFSLEYFWVVALELHIFLWWLFFDACLCFRTFFIKHDTLNCGVLIVVLFVGFQSPLLGGDVFLYDLPSHCCGFTFTNNSPLFEVSESSFRIWEYYIFVHHYRKETKDYTSFDCCPRSEFVICKWLNFDN